MSIGTITNIKKIFSGLDRRMAFCGIGLVVFVATEILFSPIKAFLFMGFVLLLACSWYRPLWVLIVIATLLPFEPFLLKWVSDDVYVFARYASELMIYAVFGVTTIKMFFQRNLKTLDRNWYKLSSPLVIPFTGFILVAVLSTFVNHNNFLVDVMGLRQLIRFILLYFAVVLLRPDEKWISRLTIILFGIVFFESCVGILQALAGGGLDWFLAPAERKYFEMFQLTQGTNVFWQEGQRVFATLGRYDQLGTFLCFFILLAIGIVYENISTKWRHVLYGIVVTGCVALVLTYSRASWFGFVLGVVVIAIAIKRDKRVFFGFIAALLIGVSMYAVLGIAQQYRIDVADQTIVERLFEAFSSERIKGEYYALGRMFFLIKTPPAVLAHAPLFGVGPGAFGGGTATALHVTEGYTILNLPYGINGTEGYIDNSWLSILGETGYVGFVLYVVMMIILFRSAYRVCRSGSTPFLRGLALGYCGALIAFAFQGLFATYFEVRTIAPYIWLFGGIIAVEEMQCRELLSPIPSGINFRGRVFSAKNPSKLPPSRSVNPENRYPSVELSNSETI